MKKSILSFALAAVCASALTSCTPTTVTTYSKTYSYEAKLGVAYGTTNDMNLVLDELNAVIGPDAAYETGLSSPADERMKAGFAAVQTKYEGKLEGSAYFTYKLVKIVHDSDPAAELSTQEELGTYKFGDALQNPYAFYCYTSTYKTAMENLRAMKDQLPAEDYKTSGQTLMIFENAFKSRFSDYNWKPCLVCDSNDDAVKNIANEIWLQYAGRQTAVDITFAVGRTDLFTGAAEILWQETFSKNL